MIDNNKKQVNIQIMQILKNWGLDNKEKLLLLNLPKQIKARYLHSYESGEKVFDFNDELILRFKIISGIYSSLQTSYPTNTQYASIWLRRKNKRFNNTAPLVVMLNSIENMQQVWSFLDCTQNWKN